MLELKPITCFDTNWKHWFSSVSQTSKHCTLNSSRCSLVTAMCTALFPQLSNRAVSRSHVKGADIKQRMSLMLRFQRKVRFLLYSFMAVADNCFLSYTYTKFMNIITAAQCWIQSEGSIDLCINQKPSSSSSIYKEKKKKDLSTKAANQGRLVYCRKPHL